MTKKKPAKLQKDKFATKLDAAITYNANEFMRTNGIVLHHLSAFAETIEGNTKAALDFTKLIAAISRNQRARDTWTRLDVIRQNHRHYFGLTK